MSTPRQAGRQRSATTQAAILQATRDLLLEVGYQTMTIEAVAARSGAGKATIYRWWPSKGALVLEASADHLDIGRVPDTGNTREDVMTAVRQAAKTFSDPLAGLVIFVVLARLEKDPSLAVDFRKRWVEPWRASLAAALTRGASRGDLRPGADIEFLVDVIAGVVFQRTLVRADLLVDKLDGQIADLIFAP